LAVKVFELPPTIRFQFSIEADITQMFNFNFVTGYPVMDIPDLSNRIPGDNGAAVIIILPSVP
jgi:hypothetical protein